MRAWFTPDVRSLPRGFKPTPITDDIISDFRLEYEEFGVSDEVEMTLYPGNDKYPGYRIFPGKNVVSSGSGNLMFSDALIRRALEKADAETGSLWGKYHIRNLPQSLKQRGMFAWAAHYLTMRLLQRQIAESNMNGGGGVVGVAYPVTSKSVGDESTSYAVPSLTASDMAANGDLNMTAYGLEFLRLRKRATAGAWMV